jgi:hypothetical protein
VAKINNLKRERERERERKQQREREPSERAGISPVNSGGGGGSVDPMKKGRGRASVGVPKRASKWQSRLSRVFRRT